MARRCKGTAASTGKRCGNKVATGSTCGRCLGVDTAAAPQPAMAGAMAGAAGHDPFAQPAAAPPTAASHGFSIDPQTGRPDAVEVAETIDGLEGFDTSADTRLWLDAMREVAPDSPEAHVAAHGRAYDQKAPLPEDIAGSPWRRRSGECYANAARSIMGRGTSDDELTYVEGYASDGPMSVPVRHAWLVDGDGRVIDPTPGWSSGRGYVGVAPGNSEVRQRFATSSTWIGVLDDR